MCGPCQERWRSIVEDAWLKEERRMSCIDGGKKRTAKIIAMGGIVSRRIETKFVGFVQRLL